MRHDSVFEKTELASTEIRVSSLHLTPKQRRVLIMIDGKRTSADLEMMLRPGELEPIIQTLLELRLIASFGESGQQHVGSPVVPSPAKPVVQTFNDPQQLKLLQRKATHIVEAALGMSAMDLCLRLEKTTSMGEFLAVSEKVVDVLASTGHRKAAEQYRHEVLGN
jgi:hypothetical protein